MREGGGLTVSFNGNEYALREAEFAIIADNTVVTSVLADPDAGASSSAARPARAFEVELIPGERKEALRLEGPGALQSFWLRLGADDLDAVLERMQCEAFCHDAPPR